MSLSIVILSVAKDLTHVSWPVAGSGARSFAALRTTIKHVHARERFGGGFPPLLFSCATREAKVNQARSVERWRSARSTPYINRENRRPASRALVREHVAEQRPLLAVELGQTHRLDRIEVGGAGVDLDAGQQHRHLELVHA